MAVGIGNKQPGPGGVILLYHRVGRVRMDPQLLTVMPENFAAHLEIIKEWSVPGAVREMVGTSGMVGSKRRVAITFDDGYADNLLEAQPILEEAGMPGTVYVSTGGIGAGREYFWDELGRIFLEANKLPRQLRLKVGDEVVEKDLGEGAEYLEAQWAENKNWNVLSREVPTVRQRIYLDLCGLLHNAKLEERAKVLGKLVAWSGLGEQGREDHRMMTLAEVKQLARAGKGDAIHGPGRMEVGAHTIMHPLLSMEDEETQTLEIMVGKAQLEKMIDAPVVGFSYPFGCRKDYNQTSVELARQAGFEYACSNFLGVVNVDTDRYQLPRVIVRNWTGQEFREHMEKWLSPPMSK